MKKFASKKYRQKHKKEKQLYDKEYYIKNREKRIHYSKKYYREHMKEIKISSKRYHQNHRKDRNIKARIYGLKHTYNLSLEEYNNILKLQGGVCAICKKQETRIIKGTIASLCVDHNHKTGKVRGLLCYHCNVGLGIFRDGRLLKRAIKYINRRKIN